MLHGIITRHVNVHVFERVAHIILEVRYRFQIVLIFALSPARDSRSPFPAFHDYECYVYSSSALLSVNLGLAAILETGWSCFSSWGSMLISFPRGLQHCSASPLRAYIHNPSEIRLTSSTEGQLTQLDNNTIALAQLSLQEENWWWRSVAERQVERRFERMAWFRSFAGYVKYT